MTIDYNADLDRLWCDWTCVALLQYCIKYEYIQFHFQIMKIENKSDVWNI